MVKLGPGRWSSTRAVIAGFLAWLLAFQGFAFASSPHGRLSLIAAGLAQAVSPGSYYCGGPRGDGPHSPGQYDHCQCCILRSSSDAGGLAWIKAIPLTAVVFPAPRAMRVVAWRFAGSGNKPPSGWTSSWSQRAPPPIS
jgi:hypothetical protein